MAAAFFSYRYALRLNFRRSDQLSPPPIHLCCQSLPRFAEKDRAATLLLSYRRPLVSPCLTAAAPVSRKRQASRLQHVCRTARRARSVSTGTARLPDTPSPAVRPCARPDLSGVVRLRQRYHRFRLCQQPVVSLISMYRSGSTSAHLRPLHFILRLWQLFICNHSV